MQLKTFTTTGLASLLTCLLGFQGQMLADSHEGLPGRRVGSGTRGTCSLAEKQLTALVPANNLGLTSAAYPMLFFYVPQDSEPKPLEFVLRDEKDRLVYEAMLETSGQPGIMALDLKEAKALPPLQLNQHYHWYLSLLCDPEDRARDIVVEGWVQRVETASGSMNQVAAMQPIEQAEFFAESGLWLNALEVLATLRYDRPEDVAVAEQWAQLLQSMDLAPIAREPLLPEWHSDHLVADLQPE